MAEKHIILLAGGTGQLGTMIADALLDTQRASLRVLVRPGSRAKAAKLEARGAQIIESNLADADALSRAADGAYTLVSAVQGGPEAIIDGQLRLLQAAREGGARRFIPSDFSFDFFGLGEGENINSDWRRSFARSAEEARGHVELVHPFNGCFLDRQVLFGFLGAFDLQAGTLSIWGDGDQPMDFTTFGDTAAYTAAAALDPDELPSRFNVVGDVLDAAGLARAYEQGSGRRIDVRTLGTLAELDEYIAELQSLDAANLYAYLPLMYWRAMLSGKGKLGALANSRYPHIRPLSVKEYVAQERL